MTEPPAAEPPNQDGAQAQHEIDLETVLGRRTPPRRRLLQGAALVLAFAVLAALIARSVLSQSGRQGAASPTPAPLGPMLVVSNVSFGSVTVNGRQEGTPPFVSAFLTGTNTLVLTAPLFRSLTCQVLWPQGLIKGHTSGSCDVVRDELRFISPGGPSYVAVIELWLSGADLPSDALARTLTNVNGVLGGVRMQTSVPAQEYVATGVDGQGKVIAQQVAGAWQAALIASTLEIDSGGELFCAAPGCTQLPGTTPRWLVAVAEAVQWRFTPAAAGQRPYSSATYQAYNLRLVLSPGPDGAWQIDQQDTDRLNGFALSAGLPNTVCAAGLNYVNVMVADGVVPDQFSPSTTAQRGLEGCVFQLTDVGDTIQGTLIWRFGVLLAADAQAHRLVPALPLAPRSAFTAVGLPVPAGF